MGGGPGPPEQGVQSADAAGCAEDGPQAKLANGGPAAPGVDPKPSGPALPSWLRE